MKLGERSINMARIFNIREGFTSKDDTLPEVFYQNFKGGPLEGQSPIAMILLSLGIVSLILSFRKKLKKEKEII